MHHKSHDRVKGVYIQGGLPLEADSPLGSRPSPSPKIHGILHGILKIQQAGGTHPSGIRSCWKKFCRTSVLFVEPVTPLFCTSGDTSSNDPYLTNNYHIGSKVESERCLAHPPPRKLHDESFKNWKKSGARGPSARLGSPVCRVLVFHTRGSQTQLFCCWAIDNE